MHEAISLLVNARSPHALPLKLRGKGLVPGIFRASLNYFELSLALGSIYKCLYKNKFAKILH